MFNPKFSLESAYSTGAKSVLNHFMFFVVSMFAGVAACALYLGMLGIIAMNVGAMRYHVLALINMFKHVLSMPTGPLHYAGTTVQESIRSYVSPDVASQILGRDVISIDISGYDIAYLASWLIPTALVLKLMLDVIFIGWAKVALDASSKKEINHRYMYEFYYLAPRVFVANLVVGLAAMAGAMLFLLPGVFLYERLRFAKYFIIDKNLSIVKSLQASWALTEGSVLHLFGFTLISTLINSLSNVLVLGAIFTVPLTNQAEANVYIQMKK
jgi:hypothetical protein